MTINQSKVAVALKTSSSMNGRVEATFVDLRVTLAVATVAAQVEFLATRVRLKTVPWFNSAVAATANLLALLTSETVRAEVPSTAPC